ncbi:LysR family transcriptional regulator [Salipiger pacificus]|nr:LysR family transcriptional regulator [Alloyangia pacifica]
MDDMILMAEVAEAGSFTRAGERLGMPKSTVSQRIAQLEAHLGLRLLNRSTRKVSLTEAGRVYFDFCQRVRAETAAASIAMSNLKDQPTGRLRITCPEVTATHFMPDFLHSFAAAFPGISVDLLATNRPLDIIRDRIDFAFRVGSTTGQDFVLRRISSIRRVLVASPRYLATNGSPGTPQDLPDHNCLVHDTRPEWAFSLKDDQYKLRPTGSMTSDSMGFLLEAALMGSGVALLPAYVCRSAIATGRLVPLLADWSIPPYDMTLVFPYASQQSRPQAAFRNFAQTYDFARLSS